MWRSPPAGIAIEAAFAGETPRGDPGGVILFAREDGLDRLPVSGGVAARITQADAVRHETALWLLQLLPLAGGSNPEHGPRSAVFPAGDKYPGSLLGLRQQTLTWEAVVRCRAPTGHPR